MKSTPQIQEDFRKYLEINLLVAGLQVQHFGASEISAN